MDAIEELQLGQDALAFGGQGRQPSREAPHLLETADGAREHEVRTQRGVGQRQDGGHHAVPVAEPAVRLDGRLQAAEGLHVRPHEGRVLHDVRWHDA